MAALPRNRAWIKVELFESKKTWNHLFWGLLVPTTSRKFCVFDLESQIWYAHTWYWMIVRRTLQSSLGFDQLQLYRLLISHWVPAVFCNEGCNQWPEQWLWILTIVLYHMGKMFVHAWRCWHLRKHFQGSSLKCYSKGNLQHFQCWFERILQGNPESCRFGSQNMIFVFSQHVPFQWRQWSTGFDLLQPQLLACNLPQEPRHHTPLATKVGISSGAGVWRRNADSSPWGSGELWQLWAAQCIPNFDILWLHGCVWK